MSPPIQKDWWLAAALTGAALPAAMGQVPATAGGRPTAGIVTSVAQGASATGSSTPIYIDSASGQRLTTGPDQTLHVLFSDQSAITVGPNSNLVIAEYRYDPETKGGALVVDLHQGVVRVVGGFISKQNETVMRTPGVGSVGIRGGITVVESNGNQTSATFLFGQSMRVSDNNGNTETVTRPGFGSSFSSEGLTPPQRTLASNFSKLLSRLETSPTGGQQGSSNPPSAPPGQLISTGDTGGAGAGTPGSLAPDRLSNRSDTTQVANPSQTLRTILGSGQTPNQS
jgi:hypothetical protein